MSIVDQQLIIKSMPIVVMAFNIPGSTEQTCATYQGRCPTVTPSFVTTAA